MKLKSCFYSVALLLGLSYSLAAWSQVTVTLAPVSPPVQVPAGGGSFDFNISATNTTGSPVTFGIWCMLTLPSGGPYGPVLGPATITLPGGGSLARLRTQSIPASAPSGTYAYIANVGVYPGTIWDTDSFPFEKLAASGAELWAARYNGPGNGFDVGNAIAADALGDFCVTGHSTGIGSIWDYATIKYNSTGGQVWVSRYNGPGNGGDDASAIVVDGFGNVYVTGGSMGIGTGVDYATIKYDSSGAQQWLSRYNGPGNGDDYANALAVDGSGNVFVTGYSLGSGTSTDYATIMYNSSGVQQWVMRYNGPGNGADVANAIIVDGTSNTIIVGESAGSGTSSDFATVKYNSAGVEQWVSRYNGPANGADAAHAVIADGTSNTIVVGTSQGVGTSSDFATVKYNSSGVQQWVSRYNGPGNGVDNALAGIVDGTSNTFIVGESAGSGTASDYCTVKYNSSGVQQWVSRYNGPGNSSDAANAVALDGTGNIFVTGGSNGSGTSLDCATIKYNSSGVQQWASRYNGPGNGNDAANGLVVDGSGNVCVTGGSTGSGTLQDYVTIKYSSGALDGFAPSEAISFDAPLPQENRLESNYPNPFNPSTAISYQLSADSRVSLKVYDMAGRLVETLVDGWREAGTHELTFDASHLPSGMYVYRIKAGEWEASGKMMLIK